MQSRLFVKTNILICATLELLKSTVICKKLQFLGAKISNLFCNFFEWSHHDVLINAI